MTSANDLLSSYQSKRDFTKTPEPQHHENDNEATFKFVIQKHWATKLHYDFRLELDGTLKSWAVPKGPSLDPQEKRLAVQVEDHPISYAAFEGRIPTKQYGAGKVIVWDEGIWKPLGDTNQGYLNGNLKFELFGHKLQGHWALVKIKGKSEKQQPWLLIKEKDNFARSHSEYSVVDALPESVKAYPVINKSKREFHLITDTTESLLLKSGAVKAELPPKISPQLATLAEGNLEDGLDWIIEVKYDGYRLLTRIVDNEVNLFTRNGNDWTSQLTALKDEIKSLRLPSGWYDGEIVVLNNDGLPDFGLLQQSFDNQNTKNIVLYLFDLPYYAGLDLTLVPLSLRKAVLSHLLQDSSSNSVRLSQVFENPSQDILASACKLGLEGIIAKHKESHYLPRRTSSWLKLKCVHRQEFIVCGYTEPSGARGHFGALVLGVYDERGQLTHVGNVGSGFNDQILSQLKAQMDALAVSSKNFSTGISIKGKVYWIKPILVAEVVFSGWTKDGKLRHPVYKGLRTDKKASEIRREISKPTSLLAIKKPNAKVSRASPITHPDRVIDDTGTTKLELYRYYDLVKEFMMPHLEHRPVSLLRAPEGIAGQLFFQKHAEVEKLDGVAQIDAKDDQDKFLEIISSKGILSAAQWNVIEFHTSNNNTKNYQYPNRIIFDLDPGEGVSWKKIQESAEILKGFLDALSLTSFIKTSGGKGLHLVIPIKPEHEWEEVKNLSESIVKHIAMTIPQRFVHKSGPRNRVGKIFIDYLRNGSIATTVSAWSARARPGLGISIPISWEELYKVNSGDHWTVKTIHTRLDVGNEPWQKYASTQSDLNKAFKNFT